MRNEDGMLLWDRWRIELVRKEVPAWLASIITSMCQRDPTLRPVDAMDVLDHWQEGYDVAQSSQEDDVPLPVPPLASPKNQRFKNVPERKNEESAHAPENVRQLTSSTEETPQRRKEERQNESNQTNKCRKTCRRACGSTFIKEDEKTASS